METVDLSDWGQHFVIGLSGPTLDDTDRRILSTLRPLGILLLKRNFLPDVEYHEWMAGLDSLLREVRSLVGRSKIIVSIDHEGGRVHRTPAPLSHFRSAARYSAHAEQVGKIMGRELRSIGVNVSWAPCCDVHSNPQNPVIGERAFGTDPKDVSEKTSQFLRGLESEGVLGCAKHFPGHGDTSVDSHHDLPTLTLSREALEARELLPFRKMIECDVSMIMTAHICFPALDSDHPATLSTKILSGMLRNELGFRGVVVTDDLDMRAILDRYDPERIAGNALSAGCDIFLVARYPDGTSERPLVLARQLQQLHHREHFDGASLAASRGRIEALLQRMNDFTPELLPDTTLSQHRETLAALDLRHAP